MGALLAALALGAAPAAADVVAPQHDPPQADDGWQAGTCTTDTPQCSIETPDQFFRDAGAHPNVGFTQVIVAHAPPGQTPTAELRTLRVDLPVGLSVNPQATPQCDQSTFEVSGLLCPPGSAVGTSFVTVSVLGTVQVPVPATVYNIVPPDGEPARFGFNLLGNNVYLKASLDWAGDYHEGFTIEAPRFPLPVGGGVLANRLVFDGRSGDGTFITTPTTCFDPADPGFEHVYSTYLRVDSYEDPDPAFPNGSPFIESPLPPGEKPLGCDAIPFDPSLQVEPNGTATDAPAGASVEVDIPEIAGGSNRASSQLKRASVSLPAGMGLNPAAADGLEACADAQFGKGSTAPVACPEASRIGTVAIETPPLPSGSLSGPVYLGKQLSRDPASGDEFRIFADAEAPRYGISVRLIGHVAADPRTGALTATFADNPQVPFTSFRIQLDGGPKATLSTPGACGPHAATSALAPWSGNPDAAPGDGFTLSNAPGGGSCPGSLAERPFAPGYAAGPRDSQAGAFSPLELHISRADGEQELKRVDLELPPGMLGRLRGVAECPDDALAAAAANSGAAERANPSCPGGSLLGPARLAVGAGPQPLRVEGRAYLAGPYAGAPLSLALVAPAVAGPFDLGTAVVRTALFVDRDDAHVRAVSDSIPHVFGGVKLDIRSVDLALDRPGFTLNPTSCAPGAIAGELQGGGGDPRDPAAFTRFPVSAPFQASGCDRLPFAPRLYLRLLGKRRTLRRSGHPGLRAVVIARGGDANIGRVAVTLPRSIQLDQSHIGSVCTRARFAAGTCPADSVYGRAVAFTPLLDAPLRGPVYLRSGDNVLPDLAISLHGQVDVTLVGRTDTNRRGMLRNTFDAVPDVPISKFVLYLARGRKGLLVPNRGLCGKRRPAAWAKVRGQNGKRANQKTRLRMSCAAKRRKRGAHARR